MSTTQDTPQEHAVIPTAPLTNTPTQTYSQTTANPAISASTLTASSQPMNLPPPPPPQNYSLAGLPDIASLANPTTTPTESKQTQLGNEALAATDKLGGKGAAQEAANVKYGVNNYTTQLDDIVAQLNALKVKDAAIPTDIQQQYEGRGATASGVVPITAGEQRKNFIEATKLTSIGLLLQGNLAAAQKTANRAVDAEFGPVQAHLDYLKQALELNKDTLSREDKKRTEALTIQLDERQRQLNDNKENMKIIMGWTAEASKANPNNPAAALAVSKALSENDPAKALSLLSPYLSDPLAKDQALANLAKTRAETAKLNKEARAAGAPAITNPKAGLYAGVLSTILASGKFTKEQTTQLVAGINSGDDPFTVVKNQAKNIMGQTEATNVTKYETAKKTMLDLQTNLSQFYANSGKTDIFKGNYEKVINKLGEVNDPKLVDLATQIQADLQVYRNAVSGTAYSAQEGTDIASIFPGINKTQGLNEAILSGRLKAFESTIDGTYAATIGANTYAKLKAADATANPPLASTDAYAAYRTQLQPGEILVNRNGHAVAITPAELKPTDQKL